MYFVIQHNHKLRAKYRMQIDSTKLFTTHTHTSGVFFSSEPSFAYDFTWPADLDGKLRGLFYHWFFRLKFIQSPPPTAIVSLQKSYGGRNYVCRVLGL